MVIPNGFFLWGYLKQKIWTQPHNQQPQNIGNLQNAIITTSENLDPEMNRSAFNGMINRVNKCIQANGKTKVFSFVTRFLLFFVVFLKLLSHTIAHNF